MNQHLLDPTDLSVSETDAILGLAMQMINREFDPSRLRQGTKLATLFYEPSTRTRLSFTAAIIELGGHALGFSEAGSSSVSKGETVADTVRVVSKFADIIAIRHPQEGAPMVAALHASVPVINAGDGGHSHPTQTLTDLLTIKREKGRLDNLTVGLCGDLKYGRTVHSLLKALSRYKNNRFVLIAPDELRLPDYIIHAVNDHPSLSFSEQSSLEAAIPDLDVLYMTRIQKERFDDEAQYIRLKDSFILDAAKLANAPKQMIIMHPLPRVNEIAPEVDADPRAAYFRQVENGKYVRMALIHTLLKHNADYRLPEMPPATWQTGNLCKNPRCISAVEPVIPYNHPAEHNTRRCVYCDAEIL
ncbi:MAG: aspartate carbamoyltransferase [Prevotellaceae bacterium]|jgi:aspartate carbamoyltransferase catalytic subunit|nr:aspartate carbamoyltransferase [Prevotellaceae bacterium]